MTNVDISNNYKLFSDGGSRGNPGKAAASFVLFENEIQKDCGAKYLGIATNNQAEYEGLKMGLKFCTQKGIKKLDCFLDSELVVKQLNGLYKVKDAKMKSSFDEVKLLINEFDSVNFSHVPRSKNSIADRLVNEELDSVG